MTEMVTITPDGGLDSDGNPRDPGAPFTVAALDVAPGNTLFRFGLAFDTGGDTTTDMFTVFLPLRIRVGGEWVSTAEAATPNFRILVRDNLCYGRLQEWNVGGRGGVAVLAHSVSGKGHG